MESFRWLPRGLRKEQRYRQGNDPSSPLGRKRALLTTRGRFASRSRGATFQAAAPKSRASASTAGRASAGRRRSSPRCWYSPAKIPPVRSEQARQYSPKTGFHHGGTEAQRTVELNERQTANGTAVWRSRRTAHDRRALSELQRRRRNAPSRCREHVVAFLRASVVRCCRQANTAALDLLAARAPAARMSPRWHTRTVSGSTAPSAHRRTRSNRGT